MGLCLVGAPALAAFTPGQAKRLAPGPFDAAPIIQGGWANGDPSDTLTFPSSTQVSGLFYRTLDADQGSIVFWIRPEWSGGDLKRHDLFHNDVGNPGVLSLRVESTGFLVFRAGTNAGADEVSVDVSGWVPGQTHLVVARWDNDNALTGGNRLGLSIDDVHTFSTQATPPASVGGLNYVGSDNTAHYPANAIIEGLTIYRRPLFDGAAGSDVGNGDEINLIFNAGSGQDPNFVTGSWDVVFCLPTDSTTGPLASGNGQAWSHPHGAELLPGNANKGGFMLAGAPATDGWSSEGAPTSVLPLATAEKVFAGGYKVVSNAANQGIYQDITVAAGNDWVARALVHSDGTCQPRLILYDQTGGAAIGSLSGTTTSTRTAPNALILTGEAPTGSTTLRVKLVNAAASGTCFWHQVEVLANSINNPSMQRWQATTPVIPSGWTNESMDAGAPTQETTIVHSGTYAFRFQGGPDSDRSDYSLNVGAAGDFYAMGVYSYWLSGQASFPVFGGTPSWLMEYSSGNNFDLLVEANPNVWRHRAGVARRRAGGDPTFYVGQYNLAGDFIVDDFYAFALSPIALTVATASLANSRENTNELRVDGRDVWLVPGVGVTTTAGTVTFNWRPRHGAASAVAFVENSGTLGAYLVRLYGDANNWIEVYWDQANRVRMRTRAQAISNTATWNAAGAIVAGTQYAIEVSYAGGFARFKVDGTTQITTVINTGLFGVAPTNAYYGSDSAGANQGDATFSSVTATAVELMGFTAVAGDGSVVLEWRTGSELDNLGFHLYRGLSEGGPWTRVTASLIPGLGSSAVGQGYSFRDVGLPNGTRYFYRLEDVDTTSKSTFHGPVSAVPLAGEPGGAPGSGPPDSSPSGKKQGSTSSSCPDWVLASYGSSVGSDVATASLRCTRHGDPEAVSLDVLSHDLRSATLELRTGGFYALHTLSGAGEASGTVRVFVPGFDFAQDAEASALPFRRALVDAVVGRRVELAGVRAWDQEAIRGLVPSVLGETEMQVSWDGTVRPGRRALRATRRARERVPQRTAATDLARLQPSVFQGETKSAVVEISPLRFDARQQQIVLAKRVRVRLLFTGRETGESGRGRIGRRERPQKPASGELLARLFTTRPGLYAVAFEQVFPGQKRGLAASELRLERQGEAVGFHLEPVSDRFGPGGVLYFHADTTASSTDFSSEVAYELVRSRDGVQMPLVSATPSGDAVSSASLGHASLEVNRFYQPGLLEAPDLWLWEALASGAVRTESFSLAGVDAAAAQPAELEVFLQGASESGNPIDHHVSVSLNGVLIGEAQFAGKKPYRMSLSVPLSVLREGANELQLTNVADTGVSSFVFLDRFMLAHPQSSWLAGGRFEGTWSESGSVGLSGVSGAAVVVDITAAGAPRWLSGCSASGGSLRFQAVAGHRYLAMSSEGLLAPRVATPSVSSLRAVTNQADYLLIAPRAFLAAAEPLLRRRADQGLSTRAVAFEEIADEFGHGQPSAEAIQSFLSFAFQSWGRPSPRYVLLLGDSTYDPRNFTGTSQPSPLPALWTKTSYLWTVSDPLLAAVNGEDELPDLAIGRLPATTVEQAQMLVAKLIAWEDSGQGLSGLAALVADNPDLAGDFEANVHDIAESYLAGRNPKLLLLSQLGTEMRPRILEALNSGLSYLDYVGHGGGAVWASENVWNSWDAPSLLAQSQQPLLVTMNCLNGYFVAPSYDSLAESLLKAEGRGAIAAFSPSGLSLDGPAHVYHRALMAELTSGRHERLGDAILAAQQSYAQTGLMPELIGVYHLLGDPATELR